MWSVLFALNIIPNGYKVHLYFSYHSFLVIGAIVQSCVAFTKLSEAAKFIPN
jgi:hypothetical protein